jgi:hypothetical protein
MGEYDSQTPDEAVQLQVADLFAYEFSKEFENLRLRPKDSMRWALRQLIQLVDYPFGYISLLDRLELLRIIKESHGHVGKIRTKWEM